MIVLLAFIAVIYYFTVPSIKDKYLYQKKEQLKDLSRVTETIIQSQLDRVVSGEKDFATAQKDSLDRIKKIRYGISSTGYFWIHRNDALIIAHPVVPELENRFSGEIDIKYRHPVELVMSAAVRAVATEHDQFVEYEWFNPSTGRYGTKLSYIRYYKPWKWVIGNGIFIDDAERDVARILSDAKNIGIAMIFIMFTASMIFSFFAAKSKLTEEKTRSELEQTETEVRMREEQFETIFEVSPFAIIILRMRDNIILKINPAFERLTGHSSAEIMGLPITDIGIESKEDILKQKKIVEESIVSGTRRVDSLSFSITVKSGEKRDIILSAAVFNYMGEVCTVATLVDLSIQRRLQEQLSQAQKMDTVGQLAGGIAHDFNNMLAGILGSAEVLKMNLEEKDDPESEEYIDIIINAAERASELTAKLLAFSRRGKIVSTEIDVTDSIDSVIMLLKRSIDKRIEIRREFLAEKTYITGDPSLVQNALLNLALNAKDAMPDGGIMTFSTRQFYADSVFTAKHSGADPGNYIEIDVSDTGCGIPKELIPRIFDPFFTTKPVGKGTGLGLAAVYGTVREHKGILNVYSEVGAGTVFKIFFPLASEGSSSSVKDSEEVIYGSGTVLVVDDESVIRNTAYGMLTTTGYDVILAEDGMKAVEIYEREKDGIDLVVLDMVMPKMSGRETFDRLKSINPGVKVIFSSGFSPESVAGNMSESGVMGFIQKPYRISEFSLLIASAISKK